MLTKYCELLMLADLNLPLSFHIRNTYLTAFDWVCLNESLRKLALDKKLFILKANADFIEFNIAKELTPFIFYVQSYGEKKVVFSIDGDPILSKIKSLNSSHTRIKLIRSYLAATLKEFREKEDYLNRSLVNNVISERT